MLEIIQYFLFIRKEFLVPDVFESMEYGMLLEHPMQSDLGATPGDSPLVRLSQPRKSSIATSPILVLLLLE